MSVIQQRIPLGVQWQTADPFLFCVHHDDHYPVANAELGPAASLAGRTLGQDFEGTDGWRMYHGQTVPGFPAHPHRGFETVTWVRRGLIDHSDSLGAAARFGRGDVQWLTAGTGVMHSEMFPLLDRERPNPLELFQIWLNLPASDKLAEPHFSMLWDDQIPRHVETDAEGHRVEVTVIAGSLGDATPPPPPPSSWASRPESDLAIWHIEMQPGSTWELPAARTGSEPTRTLYVFAGAGVSIDGDDVGGDVGVVIDAGRSVQLSTEHGVEILMLQARPLREPVAQYGPFVMNTRAEIEQTMRDYQRTQFGGWPWPSPDPVHGTDPTRFARHANGDVERVA